jgi:ferredoxin/flavodoxin---NADP+ reductase
MFLPMHAAIVGSGPSGFFAAEALLMALPNITVDMFERLPTPYGLVRSGVAPDHPKLKQVTLVFDRIMQSDRFTFFGNVGVGRDPSVPDLRNAYDSVILACGASADRKMGIPGEDLANSHSATEFVGWYNGHPDFRDKAFDLGQDVAVVVGHGNVAADVSRILLHRPTNCDGRTSPRTRWRFWPKAGFGRFTWWVAVALHRQGSRRANCAVWA